MADPGDYIFGDKDGVLVIPGDLAGVVIEGAEKRLARENLVRKEIYNTDNILELNKKIGRW